MRSRLCLDQQVGQIFKKADRPGRELFSAMKLRFQIAGAKLAEQAEAVGSGILSCFEIEFTIPWQATAWSPNLSNVLGLQLGYFLS